ncbi:MAG: YtxH domain-containing protein [Clostridiales bacterium]
MNSLKKFKNINFKSKQQQKKERSRNLTLGIILGTAIGTAVGVFSQTDKGKQATKEVVTKAKDIKDKSKVVLFDSVEKIKIAKNKIVEKVNKNDTESYDEESEENVKNIQ